MYSAHPERKQKIKHELKEMLGLCLYLTLFFCAGAAYKMFLLKEYNVTSWDFGRVAQVPKPK
jgi:hypothetical protein